MVVGSNPTTRMMSLYNRHCDRCEMRTTHEDSHPGEERDDFVSVHEEDGRGRFIYCRLCERGNSPADYELDEDIVRKVITKYPQVMGEVHLGDETAFDFIKTRVVEGHEEKYDKYQHPWLIAELLERNIDGYNTP